MKIKQTKLKDVYVIDPEPRVDSRGFFYRVFAKEILKKHGISYDIVHINKSMTVTKGTIRGIHYQTKPMQEDKIVQCLKGSIYDVAVDIRPGSKTFGQWVGVELSEKNQKMLVIPKGCAHAFQTLRSNCVVEYFVSQYYSPDKEKGIRYDDQMFKIKWPIPKIIVSEKDNKWPPFNK